MSCSCRTGPTGISARFGPVPEPAIETIALTRQYPLSALVPAGRAARAARADEMDLLTVTGPDGVAEEFVTQTALIAAPGWRVSILTPTAPAIAQAWTALGSRCCWWPSARFWRRWRCSGARS
jgi:C4-dicarboxylate-specific signal transduction histidine kinase